MDKYCEFSNKQLKLLTWWLPNSPYKNHNGIICDGSIRSGKTLVMSLSFLFWAMTTFNRHNFVIAGKSVGAVRRNVITDLKERLKYRGYTVSDNRSDNLLIVRKGSIENYFYVFGGRDERSQDYVQGMTLAGIFLDEVALMPRSFVEQCMGRCSVTGSKYWFNCNPESPMHWFKIEELDKADEKKLLHLHFTLHDNPSLSNEIIERYESIYSGVYYLRFILGNWVNVDGVIYDCFDKEKNTFTALPKYLEEDGYAYYGCDYGTANPHVYLEGFIDREISNIPTLYITKEYYYSGRNEYNAKSDQQYVADFFDFNEGQRYKSIAIDPSAKSFITAARQSGIKVSQADNDVQTGIKLVYTMMHNGLIKINADRCPNLMKELGTYMWDEKKADTLGKEQPIKQNDHACDALRYLVKTFIREREIYPWLKSQNKLQIYE